MKQLLLVNLGTPISPSPKDVYRYLIEFLTDPNVIDFPWLKRQLLVRGIIVPNRYKASAASYREIWTDEGSPLLVYGKRVQDKLQKRLEGEYQVELAMRYQNPSIQEALTRFQDDAPLTILPLFPQYAQATTGSIFEAVKKITNREFRFVKSFADDPHFIEAFCERGLEKDLLSYDEILFSFHGLPLRQAKKSHYVEECFQTAKGIAEGLKLKSYRVVFQSRLGKEEWVKPYTEETIIELAKSGAKRILIFCPAFVADCLETIHEIGIEYRELFQSLGGETLDYVESLNDHPKWIEALSKIVTNQT